tara:strand:- start:77 stop:700 length:624 start_codon:yes stop_codon:yes gene_type:complete
MFNYINPKINAFALASPDNLADVVAMVVLSIQQPWHSVGQQMQDYKKVGINSRFIWGNKKRTIQYLNKKKHVLFGSFLAVLNSNKSIEDKNKSLLGLLLHVPGLGLAKAGFVIQLVVGQVGCIDSHNIKKYGVKESILRIPTNASPRLRAKKIEDYVALCASIGCASLWDNWCNLIADKQPKHFINGDHVSRVHLDYLTNAGGFAHA